MRRGILHTIFALTLMIGFFSIARADVSPPDPQRVSADALTPRDDAEQDPSFLKFRQTLLETIDKQDSKALLAVVATDIEVSFGEESGKDEFVKSWKPANKDSQVWPMLRLLLNEGGTFKIPTQFVAPYVSAIWPEDRDVFEYVAIVAPQTQLHAAPKAGSAVLRTLNFDIVGTTDTAGLKLQHECTDTDWVKVKTKAGEEGYVLCREVRSPIDYRAYFEKKAGKWVMTVLIAGD